MEFGFLVVAAVVVALFLLYGDGQRRVREGGYQPPRDPNIKPPTQPPNVGSAIQKPPDKPRQ